MSASAPPPGGTAPSLEGAILSAAEVATNALGTAQAEAVNDLVDTLTATASSTPSVLHAVPLSGTDVRLDGAHALVTLWALDIRFRLSGHDEVATASARIDADTASFAILTNFLLKADTSFIRAGGVQAVRIANAVAQAATDTIAIRIGGLMADHAAVNSPAGQALLQEVTDGVSALTAFASRFPTRPDELTVPLVAALDASVALAGVQEDVQPALMLLQTYEASWSRTGVPFIWREAALAASDVALWYSLVTETRTLAGQYIQALEATNILLSLPASRAHPLQARAARARTLLLHLLRGESSPLPQLMAPHVKSDLTAKPATLLTQARGMGDAFDQSLVAASSLRRQARGGSQSAALLASAEEAKRMAVYQSFERAFRAGDSAAVRALVSGDKAHVFAQDKTLALAQTCAQAHPARRIQKAAHLYSSASLVELANFLHINGALAPDERAARVAEVVEDAVSRGWVQARIEPPYVHISPTPFRAVPGAAELAPVLRAALADSRNDLVSIEDRSRQIEATPAFLVAAAGTLAKPSVTSTLQEAGTPGSITTPGA